MPTIPDVTRPVLAPVYDARIYPYNSLVRITRSSGGNRYPGIGVMISPDEVLTTDHVSYYSGDGQGVASDIVVQLDLSVPGQPVAGYSGTVAHYFRISDDAGTGFKDIQTDYSIIYLSTPVINGSVMQVAADFAVGDVHISGYPGSSFGLLINDVQTVAIDPNYPVFDSVSLGPGSSGSPVWRFGADGRASVVGIVSAETGAVGYNVWLTAAQAAQIAAWVAADDQPGAPSGVPRAACRVPRRPWSRLEWSPSATARPGRASPISCPQPIPARSAASTISSSTSRRRASA